MKTRTTVTLDQDVFDLVRREASETRRRFGEVLNERIRLSFVTRGKRPPKFAVRPFQTKGFAPGIDESKLNQLLDTLETEKARR